MKIGANFTSLINDDKNDNMKNLLLLIFLFLGLTTTVSAQYLRSDNARAVFFYTDGSSQKVSVRTLHSKDAALYANLDVERVDIYGCIEVTIENADGNIETFSGAVPGPSYEYDINVPDATYPLDPADFPISNLLTVTRTGGLAVLYTEGQYKGKKYYLGMSHSLSGIVLQSWKVANGYYIKAHGKTYTGKTRQFNGAITEAVVHRDVGALLGN